MAKLVKMPGRRGRPAITSTTEDGRKRLGRLLPSAVSSIEHQVKSTIHLTCPSCGHRFNIAGGGDKDLSRWVVEFNLGRAKLQDALADESRMRIEQITIVESVSGVEVSTSKVPVPPSEKV